MLKYEEIEILINRVDTHSLRSGGTCALSISGYLDRDIMKRGRWSPNSKAFMEYIQQQLSSFSVDMADDMSKIGAFLNTEGSTKKEDLRKTTIF